MKKFFSIILISALTLSLLTGCGTGTTKQSTSTAKATEQAAASSETITFSSDKITCSDSDVSIEDNVITISKTGNYTVSGSNTILTQDTSKTYNCVIISCPELKEGSTYTLTTASTSQEFTPSYEAVQNN